MDAAANAGRLDGGPLRFQGAQAALQRRQAMSSKPVPTLPA